jgi:hypothetical protein
MFLNTESANVSMIQDDISSVHEASENLTKMINPKN